MVCFINIFIIYLWLHLTHVIPTFPSPQTPPPYLQQLLFRCSGRNTNTNTTTLPIPLPLRVLPPHLTLVYNTQHYPCIEQAFLVLLQNIYKYIQGCSNTFQGQFITFKSRYDTFLGKFITFYG